MPHFPPVFGHLKEYEICQYSVLFAVSKWETFKTNVLDVTAVKSVKSTAPKALIG